MSDHQAELKDDMPKLRSRARNERSGRDPQFQGEDEHFGPFQKRLNEAIRVSSRCEDSESIEPTSRPIHCSGILWASGRAVCIRGRGAKETRLKVTFENSHFHLRI